MHTIWKFPIPRQDCFTLALPRRARFLDVQIRHEAPYVWFLLDPEAEKEPRRFVIAGTGHPIPETEMLTYLGTFQLFFGERTYHLFEYDALAPVRP